MWKGERSSRFRKTQIGFPGRIFIRQAEVIYSNDDLGRTERTNRNTIPQLAFFLQKQGHTRALPGNQPCPHWARIILRGRLFLWQGFAELPPSATLCPPQ